MIPAPAEGARAVPFGARLQDAVGRLGPLCAGIDPHPGLLTAWGLNDDVRGLRRFSLICAEAFAAAVPLVKPQSAFYERFGASGIVVLEDTLGALRASGTLTLVDVKRGDIGSTMEGYAQAYLGQDSPLRADAMTVSPFLGYGSLRPALDLADRTGRGVFVLTLTSNPDGFTVQHAERDGRSVAGAIVDEIRADNAAAARAGTWGSVGMVVGATVGSAPADLGLDLAGAAAPLLAPGVGAQGGTAQDLRTVFGAALPRVLAASSREILGAGPDVRILRAKAIRVAAQLRDAVGA